MSNDAWSKQGLADEQKNALIARYEELVLVLAREVGAEVVLKAMNQVANDPMSTPITSEMPPVTWERKPFEELDPSPSQQRLSHQIVPEMGPIDWENKFKAAPIEAAS